MGAEKYFHVVLILLYQILNHVQVSTWLHFVADNLLQLRRKTEL